MKKSLFTLALLVVAACSSTPPTSTEDARTTLENRYNKRIGTATKQDFVEYFGTAEWCRPQPSGEETCRYYKKVATKWVGESGRDKKNYDAFDEVVAEFDTNGKLRGFEAKAQR